MNVHDRLVIASAIEKLITGGEDTAENASIIISAFHDMKKKDFFTVRTKDSRKGDSVEGMTEHGNASFQTEEQEGKTIRGLNEQRVGKWVVWREVTEVKNWWRKVEEKKQIWFCHFLSQDTNSERDRKYFLEYGDDLSPIAFGYLGEPEYWLSLGVLSIYRDTIVVVLGKTKMKRSVTFCISNSD